MKNFRVMFALWAVTVLVIGCSDGRKKFPVEAVTGQVTCLGKPVPKAMVYFEPIRDGGNSSIIGKQGFAFAEDDGTFVLSTYGSKDGAVIGKHRVRVGLMGGPPCECVTNSEIDIMHVEVKEGVKNHFDVVLKKATRRDIRAQRLQDQDD